MNVGGVTSADWAAVLAFLPVFEQLGFSPGKWEGDNFSAFYSYHPEVLRFLETLDSSGVIYGFEVARMAARSRTLYARAVRSRESSTPHGAKASHTPRAQGPFL